MMVVVSWDQVRVVYSARRTSALTCGVPEPPEDGSVGDGTVLLRCAGRAAVQIPNPPLLSWIGLGGIGPGLIIDPMTAPGGHGRTHVHDRSAIAVERREDRT